jgi:hypothetical protein
MCGGHMMHGAVKEGEWQASRTTTRLCQGSSGSLGHQCKQVKGWAKSACLALERALTWAQLLEALANAVAIAWATARATAVAVAAACAHAWPDPAVSMTQSHGTQSEPSSVVCAQGGLPIADDKGEVTGDSYMQYLCSLVRLYRTSGHYTWRLCMCTLLGRQCPFIVPYLAQRPEPGQRQRP